MWPRILIASVIGGIVVFIVGAICHARLKLQTRSFQNIPDNTTFVEQLTNRGLKPGFYVFPDMPTDEEQKDKERNKVLNERYKAGPSGMLLVVRPGDDMMSLEIFGKEVVSDIIAAFLAAWIVSLCGADIRFGSRWMAVLLMGVFAWVSLTASYGIWYRFPHDFVHDELYCALLEWGVAGLVIAAIVRRPPVASPVQPT
jgi:hypothetical protein